MPTEKGDIRASEFRAAPSSTELSIDGMTCQGCARRVREALEGVAGVKDVDVQLERACAVLRWEADVRAEPAKAIQAVKAAGYGAKLVERQEASRGTSAWSPFAGWRFNVVVGAAATLPLVAGEWLFGLGSTRWFIWASFLLAVPVQTLCGARFYRGAWTQLKAGAANMDTLVALGSTTAFAYSVSGLVSGWTGHLYFTEAAAIITLISVGHWLEARASERAADSLRALMSLAPPTARRLDKSGRENEVPVSVLVVGDTVVLRPGDHVPADGVVIEGSSAVEEAMLTGESMPVDKAPGMPVYAGTVNRDGRLAVRVSATGETTALAHIIKAVRRAQESRARMQRLGDRVSNVFVPAVVAIAVTAALWWGLDYESARRVCQALMPFLWHASIPAEPLAAAVIHAAAVLIVACPCAMGLATPVAIMAAANVAARRGMLIRDATALEKSGQLDAVVFDKTGTLTTGRASVAAIEAVQGTETTLQELTSLAMALASHSNHPLSQAIARLAPNNTHSERLQTPASGPGAEMALEQWSEVRGCGVQARCASREARLGSLTWFEGSGVNLEAASGFREHWSAQGATVLGLATGNRLEGLIALEDTLKPHAAMVVSQLAGSGKMVCLVTGDSRATALAVARSAGIAPENVHAQVRPEQKAEFIRRLQQRGLRVAFVGDGINDAPALEQADLGVAVARASDIAREAADLILLRTDIEAIPEAIGLAQASLRTIKQNLFWAFFYNAAAVPLAALGYISPILCAAAMGLSDLLVIGNALRLRYWRMR